jgi:hypothetical protein
MKRTLRLLTAAAPALAPAVVPGVSVADQKGGTLIFCSRGDDCVLLYAENQALVTVQSVTVRQLLNKSAGCMAVKKRHTG